MGHRAIVSPLSVIRPVSWTMPPGPFDAVLLTSARALWPGPALPEVFALPAHAVGNLTARAARTAGFSDVREGRGDGAQALLGTLAPLCRLLWLAGADRTAVASPPGVRLTIVETYAADPAPLCPGALIALAAGEVDWTLVYSTRALISFAQLLETADIPRSRTSLAAISPAALAAAPDGWRVAAAAIAPNEAALFAVAGL